MSGEPDDIILGGVNMLKEKDLLTSAPLFEGLKQEGFVVVSDHVTNSPITNEAVDRLLTIKAVEDRLISFEDEWPKLQQLGYEFGYVLLPIKSARVHQYPVGRDVVADILCVNEHVLNDLDERMGAYQNHLFNTHAVSASQNTLDAIMKTHAMQMESEILMKEMRGLNHCEAYRYHIGSDSAARRYLQLKQTFYDVKAYIEQQTGHADESKLARLMFG